MQNLFSLLAFILDKRHCYTHQHMRERERERGKFLLQTSREIKQEDNLSYHILDLVHVIRNTWLMGRTEAVEISHVIKIFLAKAATQSQWILSKLICPPDNLQNFKHWQPLSISGTKSIEINWVLPMIISMEVDKKFIEDDKNCKISTLHSFWCEDTKIKSSTLMCSATSEPWFGLRFNHSKLILMCTSSKKLNQHKFEKTISTINFNSRLRTLNEYYAWGSLGRWGQSLELNSLQFWDHVLKQLHVDQYVLP